MSVLVDPQHAGRLPIRELATDERALPVLVKESHLGHEPLLHYTFRILRVKLLYPWVVLLQLSDDIDLGCLRHIVSLVLHMQPDASTPENKGEDPLPADPAALQRVVGACLWEPLCRPRHVVLVAEVPAKAELPFSS